MATTTYASLKLKTDTSVKEIEFNGSKIEVLQYLPIDDKYSLVNITLQKSKDGSIYHPLKKDMYFHLNLVYLYTNLSFTDKQREDESKLYDALQSSGLLNLILENIPEEEYEILYSFIEEYERDILNYQNTIAGIIANLIESLPARAEEMQKIVDNFNPENFQEVLNFARAIK